MNLIKNTLSAAFAKVAKRSLHVPSLTSTFLLASALLGAGEWTTRNVSAQIKTDVDIAADHVQNNAFSRSQGRCAEKVREGIEQTGVVLKRAKSAKDYGASIERVGFQPAAALPSGENYPPQNYEPQKGDVVIIQPTKGHPHGHMAMYTDAGIWTSDFMQDDFWPSKTYAKNKPPATFYRAKQIISAREEQLFHQASDNTAQLPDRAINVKKHKRGNQQTLPKRQR